MDEPIRVNDRVRIPPAAIEVRFVRASGPGGQNVNKVASKVQMRIDLSLVEGLTPDEAARVRLALAARLDSQGSLQLSCQETRDQRQNLVACAAKAADLLRAALQRPKVRRPTRPTRSSRERRVEEKRQRASRLANRRINDEG